MQKLLGLTLEELGEVVSSVGLRTFAAKQMAAWLYMRGTTDIDEMTDIPKKAREELKKRGWVVGRENPKVESRSIDGTAKYLFEGVGGRDVEAVIIPDKERTTICISSQAGCKMNCSFCMTGRGGFQGNLDAGQIVNQLLSVPESQQITNVVFMGMGEPTDNLENVLKAIRIMTESWGMAKSPRRITVSTIGKLDSLKRILEQTQVHIAVSLHSPYSTERAGIMPIEKAYPTSEILNLLRQYDFAHQRRLSMEYTMFKGLNDDLRHAESLARLLKGMNARVNLIRFHRIPGFDGEPSSQATMESFRDKLNEKGVTATIRASRGEDIMAACGMLAGAKHSSNSNTN